MLESSARTDSPSDVPACLLGGNMGQGLNDRIPLLLLVAVLPTVLSASSPLPSIEQPFPAAVDRAPISLLVDLSAGQTLYAHNAERRFLPASMTKAMTALVAFDLIASGRLKEGQVITVHPETARRWAGKGTTLNLRPGEEVTVRQLLHGIATVSANDASVALAEGALGSNDAWLAAMNARAKGLGMTSSHFATPNGFPDRGQTYVNARDLIRLAEALINDHPQLYRRYIGQKSMDWRGERLTSHDPFAGVLRGADGIKTGHTFEAGFNFLGAVERRGRRLVLVIAGARTEHDRTEAAKALAEWGYGAWDSQAWLVKGARLGKVRVQQGSAREVSVTVPRPFALTVKKGQHARLEARIHYEGPLIAPVVKGTRIGGLEVRIAGREPYILPLVAADDVSSAGPFDRLANGLLGLMP